MHTDKRIDEVIVPEQLFLLDLSEKTSLDGELAGGNMVSRWRGDQIPSLSFHAFPINSKRRAEWIVTKPAEYMRL